MKLFYADLSPYARKARATIIEKSLTDRVELVAVNPYDIPTDLNAANPLCKVPTLVTDDGGVLYDSYVICEYLDSVGSGPSMVPQAGEARFSMLRRHALVNGILDAAFNIATEVHRRDEGERSPKWLAHWANAIGRAVDVLESEIDRWPGTLDVAHITAACALEYLEIRIPQQVEWRSTHPKLVAWLGEVAQRPSIAETRPKT